MMMRKRLRRGEERRGEGEERRGEGEERRERTRLAMGSWRIRTAVSSAAAISIGSFFGSPSPSFSPPPSSSSSLCVSSCFSSSLYAKFGAVSFTMASVSMAARSKVSLGIDDEESVEESFPAFWILLLTF